MGDSADDTFNMTRCHLYTDAAAGVGGWADEGNLNHTCAVEVGDNVITGIDMSYDWNTTYGPPDLQFGASEITPGCLANSDLDGAPAGQKAKQDRYLLRQR